MEMVELHSAYLTHLTYTIPIPYLLYNYTIPIPSYLTVQNLETSFSLGSASARTTPCSSKHDMT